MIDWSKGIVAKYYATIVDPKTWRDTTSFQVIGGSITYSNSGVRGSADIECDEFDHENEYWIRVYIEAEQDSDSELVPLFTGLACAPDISYNGKVQSNKIKCYSSLYPADKKYLPLGWYAQAGVNGAILIKDLLSDITPAPVVIDGSSQSITQNIVAENNETSLTMVDKILNAINWHLYTEGNGVIHVAPFSSDIAASFGKEDNDVFEMNVTISNNWDEIPNVFRAVGTGIASIAKDEDPNSRYSIVNRGREIWAQDTNCILNDGEKISDYAERRLKELQQTSKVIDYTRRFIPNIRIDDYVWIKYPEQNISGAFLIESQTINLGYGGQVSEKVVGY